MVDTTGRLTAGPDAGKLDGVVAFTLLLVLCLYVHGRIEVGRVRALAYLPVALFVCFVAFAGLAQVESVTGGLFALTPFATFGVATYTYDRTGSLLPPALAYACLRVANTAVVYGLEAGLQH